MGLDFFIKFACKRSIRILSVNIKYSMHHLICEAIKYCVSKYRAGQNRPN